MLDHSLILPRFTILDAQTPEEIERADLGSFRRSLRGSKISVGKESYLRIAVADLDDARLASIESGCHSVRMSEPQFVTLLWPLRGEITVLRGRRQIIVDRGRSVLLDVGERTTSVSQGYQGMQVLLPRTLLVEALAAMAQGEAVSYTGDRVLDSLSPACAQLGSYLNATVRSLGANDQDILGSRWAKLGASRALLALVAGAAMESGASGAAATARPVALPWLVRRAEELLRARAHDSVTIAELCRELKVGERSLQLAFQRHRGTTPKRFLHECRLALARDRLLQSDSRSNVTGIAQECGFGHVGRFAVAYRQRYGESPQATLRRSRLL